MNYNNIWAVADLLRGDYKQPDYGKVILPCTVLCRLDCVLAATKGRVLVEVLRLKAANNTREQMSASKDLMTAFIEAILKSDDSQSKLSREILGSPNKMKTALDLLLGTGGSYEKLRSRGAQSHEN